MNNLLYHTQVSNFVHLTHIISISFFIVRQENERLIQDSINRAKMAANLSESDVRLGTQNFTSEIKATNSSLINEKFKRKMT
jgi:hypothetical protein